jgi:hypothetical protein
VDIVLTEGEREVMKSLQRKSEQATEMFSMLVAEMGQALAVMRDETNKKTEVPSWL